GIRGPLVTGVQTCALPISGVAPRPGDGPSGGQLPGDPGLSGPEVEVAIVGGGPAGLAAAVELRRRGVARVLVLEREPELGGIPRSEERRVGKDGTGRGQVE